MSHTLAAPFELYKWTQISIAAGNASPNAERQSAPKSEMNNSRFGIATASKTVE